MVEALSIVGLGKLGAPMAACFAARGFRVVGVDVDVRKVEAICRREPPVFEPQLAELLTSSNGRLRAACDLESAVLNTDVTFIVVATPSEPNGDFSLRYVLPVCEQIGQALRRKRAFHLVVLTSTVTPGTTDGFVRRALEANGAMRAGHDFGLCYSPEFIALGSVIHNFLNPDFMLIGEFDARSGDILEGIYARTCKNNPPVARLNLVSAEVAKLAVNTFVTMKISFANMLARICERLPDANVDSVTSALGLDSRIGPRYLKGAISYGGPCFPRDNLAMAALADRLGVQGDLARATDSFNRSQICWLMKLVEDYLPPNGVTGILGLTYKPQTDVVDDSAGLLLAQRLRASHRPIVLFDPCGQSNSARLLGPDVEFATSAKECIAEADVVVVTTPWPQFASIRNNYWARSSVPRIVIDCWRVLTRLRGVAGINYICLGQSPKLSAGNFGAVEKAFPCLAVSEAME